MYFVPGGRIGFPRQPELQFWSNAWTAHSADHTLTIDVQETIRLGPEHDAYQWDKDKTFARSDAGIDLPGYEVRRFRDLGYGDDPDYMRTAVVIRDSEWMGEVTVTTGDHGGRTKHSGGQVARWTPLIDGILRSVMVRPRLPINEALDELRVSVDTAGLHPRLIGNQLVMSLSAPGTALDSWAANTPNIRLDTLSNLFPGGPPASQSDARNAIDELFEIDRKTPTATVILGKHCRGVLHREVTVVPGQYFGTSITAYGAARSQRLTAFYDAPHRKPILAALYRVFQSLDLKDWA